MKPVRIRRGRLVDVHWDDVEHIRGWKSRREVLRDRPDRYRAAGYVLQAGRRWLVIAPVTGEQNRGSAACAYRLPWGTIRRLRILPDSTRR